ncbi:MAG: hypothetical protein U0136_19010 [Bdellovibrionota bacterium]
MDPEKLLVKVSLGKALTEAELSDVVHALTEIDISEMAKVGLVDEAYSLLHLLGRAKAYNCVQLLEKYLEAKDPLTASLVLETLCLDWGRSENYLERVIDFSLGVSWDEEDDVRQTALKVLGEYLRERLGAGDSPDPADGKKRSKKLKAEPIKKGVHVVTVGDKTKRVLDLLLAMFADPELSQSTRQGAYLALCRAAGKDWQDLPSECAVIDLSEQSGDVDHPMLSMLRQLSSDSSSE